MLFICLAVTVGCDPGFTVRQALPRSQKQSTHPPELPTEVSIDVHQFHALIGVSYYTPTVKITNSSASPIEVTGFELITSRGVSPGTLPRTHAFPAIIAPGTTQEFKIWLDLPAGLGTTLNKSAKLIAHYRVGSVSETVSANLVGRTEAASQP